MTNRTGCTAVYNAQISIFTAIGSSAFGFLIGAAHDDVAACGAIPNHRALTGLSSCTVAVFGARSGDTAVFYGAMNAFGETSLLGVTVIIAFTLVIMTEIVLWRLDTTTVIILDRHTRAIIALCTLCVITAVACLFPIGVTFMIPSVGLFLTHIVSCIADTGSSRTVLIGETVISIRFDRCRCTCTCILFLSGTRECKKKEESKHRDLNLISETNDGSILYELDLCSIQGFYGFIQKIIIAVVSR